MAKRKKRATREWTQPTFSESFAGIAKRAVDQNDRPDEKKLSAKLLDIMDPFMEDYPIETLADCAAFAWNAMVERIQGYRGTNFFTGRAEHHVGLYELIDRLKERKFEMHALDFRSIIKLQIVEDANGGKTLNVASAYNEENIKETVQGAFNLMLQGAERYREEHPEEFENEDPEITEDEIDASLQQIAEKMIKAIIKD